MVVYSNIICGHLTVNVLFRHVTEIPGDLVVEQVRIQLKRFAASVKAAPKGPPTGKATRPIADPSRPGYKPSSSNPLDDVEGLGIDTSIGAVAARVGIVLVVTIVLFVVLFYAGLQTFNG